MIAKKGEGKAGMKREIGHCASGRNNGFGTSLRESKAMKHFIRGIHNPPLLANARFTELKGIVEM